MRDQLHVLKGVVAAAAMAVSTVAVASGSGSDGNFCMDVEIDPFHMMPSEEACAVRDYWDGWLQEKYYPFTIEDHLFNCEVFGALTPLPGLGPVPSSVVSQGDITGTIGGHTYTGTLLCASQTNWYQDSCEDPEDPTTCTFQLAQPFLKQDLPFPRVTEVSIFDGVITVEKGWGRVKEVPILMATRAGGITHVENLNAPLVGASITHSLLGLLTYEMDDEEFEAKALQGSADMLLQGHIFFPGSVEEDVDDEGNNEAAVIKGAVCSKDLYRMLNRNGGNKDEDDD